MLSECMRRRHRGIGITVTSNSDTVNVPECCAKVKSLDSDEVNFDEESTVVLSHTNTSSTTTTFKSSDVISEGNVSRSQISIQSNFDGVLYF